MPVEESERTRCKRRTRTFSILNRLKLKSLHTAREEHAKTYVPGDVDGEYIIKENIRVRRYAERGRWTGIRVVRMPIVSVDENLNVMDMDIAEVE